MLSKFCSQLVIENDGDRIFARGPLKWAQGETGQCHISVTLTKGSGNSATGDTGSYSEKDHEWKANADVQSGTFHAGDKVTAHGVIHMSNGHADPWPDQRVMLVAEGTTPQCPEMDE